MYRMAKELAQILSHLTGNTKSFMTNSTEFVNNIRNLEINNKDHFASFNVASLFVSVPTDNALEIAVQRLKEDSTLIEKPQVRQKN